MGADFNGSTGYLNCGNVLNGTANMAVCAWVRRDATGVRHEVVSKEDNAAPNGWELSILASNFASFGAFNGSYPEAVGTTSLAASTVYHICGVRDNTANLLRIYVNGVQEGTTSPGAVPTASSVNLNIGRRPNSTRYFNGTIEDLRIYNRVLSVDEIQAIYVLRGRDKIHNGLLARWALVEGAPGVALSGSSPDETGAYPGTVAGTSAYVENIGVY